MRQASQRKRETNRQLRRRLFHAAIALILVICVLSPYLETAVELNGSVFASGYDTETTVAILVLLLELVLSLTNLVASLCKDVRLGERVIVVDSFARLVFGFGTETAAELSPPLPLRI